MKVFIGCSGWNYRHWKGNFYPEEMAQKDWLQHYSQHFNTVEINSTFYRFPRASTVENWKKTAPENFVFTLKANRFITHLKKLNNVRESVEKFENTAQILGNKLACTLWQLPPSLHRNDERLREFCETMHPNNKNIIEFRHSSWYDPGVYQLYNSTYALSQCCKIFCFVFIHLSIKKLRRSKI